MFFTQGTPGPPTLWPMSYENKAAAEAGAELAHVARKVERMHVTT